MTISVLVADDEREFREALAEVVERAPALRLVGTAADATEAIQLACRNRPTVAVVDVRMEGGGGTRVADYLKRLVPDVRVLALSAYDDEGTVALMLEAGASGYLLKGTGARDLVRAIERTAAGQEILSPELASPRESSATGIAADDNGSRR